MKSLICVQLFATPWTVANQAPPSMGFRRKLLKWAYGPNQSLDNLLQLAQTVYYGREYEEKKERQKKTKEKAEAFAMAMKNVIKQPEGNPT